MSSEARDGLPKMLGVLEARIGDHPFVAGANPTVADCTLFAAFNFAKFGEVEIDSRFERLHAWWERFGARASVTSL